MLDKLRRSGTLTLALGLFAVTPLAAQESMGMEKDGMAREAVGPVDGADLPPTAVDRIQIGQTAPDFTLHRIGGGTWRLSDAEGDRNVLLVFFRGHWCPYCMEQLAELASLPASGEYEDTEFVVLSVEGEELTAQTIGRIQQATGAAPQFTFVSDPESAVIGRYGVLNPNGSRNGIPHPAAFVIDREGLVRWRDVQTDYTVRPSNDDISSVLESLDGGM